jgi:chloramphenicol 3-O phosphotransferase
LEARERARGDRVLGRARGLAEVVHTFCGYDTMVDTGTMTTEACVRKVLKSLAKTHVIPVSAPNDQSGLRIRNSNI